MAPTGDAEAEKLENRWIRALYALPLLGIVYAAHQTMGKTIDMLDVPKTPKGTIDLFGNGTTTPLVTEYFGVQALDDFLMMYTGFFTPILGGFDPIGALQAFAFGGDIIAVHIIWMIESYRRGNAYTVASMLPTIIAVFYQIRGIGFLAPIYYFSHYVQNPLEKYAVAENRMTQVGPVKTIIPTIVFAYIVPSIVQLAAPSLGTRQWVNGFFWQGFPVYAAILQQVFGLFVKDTTESDRVSNTEADMPYLRRTYKFAAGIAVLCNLYVRAASPFPLMNVFFENIWNPSNPENLIIGAAKALRYDWICCYTAGAIWTMLSFADLKRAGMIRVEWLRIVGVFAGITFVVGPGAAQVAMWAWREEVLAGRKNLAAKKR